MGRKGMKCPHTHSRGLRDHAWWVLRNRKSVTLPELLDTLADGTQKDPASNLALWLSALEKAQIVRRLPVPARQTGNGTTIKQATFYVVKDCGDRAPVWRRSCKQVFIPCSGEVISLEAAPHPLPNSPIQGEGTNVPPPSRGRIGGGWVEGERTDVKGLLVEPHPLSNSPEELHPLPSSPLQGEGTNVPPPSRGRIGGGWVEGERTDVKGLI